MPASNFKFSAPAARLWNSIPADAQIRLLTNVRCPNCQAEVTLTDVSGAIRAGQILLVGSCTACRGKVSKAVEPVAKANGSERKTDVDLDNPKFTQAEIQKAIAIRKKEVAPMQKRLKELWKKSKDRTTTMTKAEDKEFVKLSEEVIDKLFGLAGLVSHLR